MKEFDTKDSFLNKEEKKVVELPNIDIGEYEIELFRKFKIRKEDIKNSIHLIVPDDLVQLNEVLRKHSSIFVFWGLVYKEAYRKAKLAEIRIEEFKMMQRNKCRESLAKRSGDKKPTKDDLEEEFLKLFNNDENYLKLKKRVNGIKFTRDRLEIVYEMMRQRKDVLIALSNNIRQISQPEIKIKKQGV